VQEYRREIVGMDEFADFGAVGVSNVGHGHEHAAGLKTPAWQREER